MKVMRRKYLSSHKFFFAKENGFTLIELLVVISVIAILTTLLMVNFVGIRQRGRDGQRKSNLYSLQSALELYRADNGAYPTTLDFPECGNSLSTNGGETVYMQEVPCDPLENTGYTYISDDGGSYLLIACLENENDGDADEEVASSCASPASFTLTNP